MTKGLSGMSAFGSPLRSGCPPTRGPLRNQPARGPLIEIETLYRQSRPPLTTAAIHTFEARRLGIFWQGLDLRYEVVMSRNPWGLDAWMMHPPTEPTRIAHQ
jgi:hypothetical protein